MQVIIFQSPLVQLNTPYPSGAYLKSFFSQQDIMNFSDIKWFDLSNLLYNNIFSKEGLTKLFELTYETALEKAKLAKQNGEEQTEFNLQRYILQKDLWINWIENIKAILSNDEKFSGRELCHEFIFSPFAPRGNRMDNFLSSLEREVTIDDARFLASFALADLADYINVVFDNNFSLIRYAEHLATSQKDFSKFLKVIDSPVLKNYLSPLVNNIFEKINQSVQSDEKILFCISVPFAGCFASCLHIGKEIKKYFGQRAIISIGGGYINTELRNINEEKLFDYVDFISYDRGYGSYIDLMKNKFSQDGKQYYKTTYFYNNKIIRGTNIDTEEKTLNEISQIENKFTKTVFPDFSEIDFSLYPRLADDVNPMHRIWSDGSWLKAYLAHGCYWHRCAFCDTSLDYVCNYSRIDTKNLYSWLYQQAKKTGIYGIHFVDEASPPKSLAEFALENSVCKNQKKSLTFWGNIRFEKTFSRDLADFLAYGGLIGVSGGIEIATGKGLQDVNKGTDFDSLVASCASFKEAGILVHAYMIYGFYSETPQDLINSMETLRQFFACGLLDSSFWHKFVLTKHSTLFTEYKKGLHPKLKPIISNDKSWFAQNDISFEGEEKSKRYTNSLETALFNWMHGNSLNKKVNSWFNFSMPQPTIPQDYVEKAIEKYEQRKLSEFNDYDQFFENKKAKFYWLGGNPIVTEEGQNHFQLKWNYFGEILTANFPQGTTKSQAKEFAEFLYSLRPENHLNIEEIELKSTKKQFTSILSQKFYKKFRGNGLCRVNF